jgi:SAM-dependent methyltransferase
VHQYSYEYPRNPISWFFLARRHQYVRRILRHSRNLDLACGLYKITRDSVGLDMKGWKQPDIQGSVFSLPFAAASFDSVTMLEIFEHYRGEDQVRILQEARRVLKRGGQLILSTPNMSRFWAIPFRLIWWIWERTVQLEYTHEHVGMIPREKVIRILEHVGFMVQEDRRVAILDLVVRCVKVA